MRSSSGHATRQRRLKFIELPDLASLRRTAVAVAVGLTASLWCAPTGEAHGPCPTCIEPGQVASGDELTVRYRTYKAVFNPIRRQLTKGPKPNCYGCLLGLWRYRVEGVKAITLGSWRPPRSKLRLKVPGAPPGRYLIALFDGSEGGTHYTWDFVEINQAGDGESALPILIPVAAMALVGTAGIAWARRVRRR